MTILPTIQLAIRSMRSNKTRTVLAILGTVIGIATVIMVYSAGEGIRSLVVGQIETFGTDIIQTEIKVPTSKKGFAAESQSGTAIAQGVQVTTLTLKDMEEMIKLPNIKNAYAGILSQQQASYGHELRKAFVFGASPSYINIDKSEIDYGRFFTDADDKSLSQVIVLGKKIKEKLFSDSDPIGKFVKLKNSKYQVIGVMKERGAVSFMDFDDYIYIPIRTLQKRFMGIDYVSYIVSQVNDLSMADNTADDIRFLLRERHNIVIDKSSDIIDTNRDDFRVTTMAEMMKMLGTVTGALTLLLLAIVSISLIVGGVGIMNIMYVIVTERTPEIGLRKALGASYKDIVSQFLIEAILITTIGGIVGIIFGIILSALVALGANSYGINWKLSFPIISFFVSIIFSFVTGIIFGVYPARKAGKLDPIEALRAE